MKLRIPLLLLGLSLFGLSMLLPAVYLRGDGGGTFTGYACALAGFWFMCGAFASLGEDITNVAAIEGFALYVVILAVCNLVLLGSAVALVFRKVPRFVRAALTSAALLVCAGRLVLPLSSGSSSINFYSGYYVWALSFVVVAAAAFLSTIYKKAQPDDRPLSRPSLFHLD